MLGGLTSRERMLRSLTHRERDHVPCCFMSFTAMRGRCQDAYEVVEEELALGLDSWLFIPSSWRNERRNHPDLRGLPVRLPPTVKTRLWSDHPAGEQYPILHKEYLAPGGILSTAVRKTDDWPHGNFVPLVDDYQVPRATKRLVTTREDVAALRTMLMPPSKDEVSAFRAEVDRARSFCRHHGVLLAGGWGVGADMVAWLYGLEELPLLANDDPGMLDEMLELVGLWSEARMRIVLEAGVDLFIRRGWYEGSDFWSPRLHRRFLLPRIKREASLAHEHGALFGLNMTTGALPMLGNLLEAGIDALVGVDPLQHGDRPLETMRDQLGGRVCLWGGINGAITVEQGTSADVQQSVVEALAIMSGVNGFVLSPVDNITEITPNAWRNVDVLVETWKRLATAEMRGQG